MHWGILRQFNHERPRIPTAARPDRLDGPDSLDSLDIKPAKRPEDRKIVACWPSFWEWHLGAHGGLVAKYTRCGHSVKDKHQNPTVKKKKVEDNMTTLKFRTWMSGSGFPT